MLPLKLWNKPIQTMMDKLMLVTISNKNIYISYLITVISMTADLLMPVKSTLVLLCVKMLGEMNTVQNIHTPPVHVTSTSQNA
jgi:hypothetical protein